MQQKRQGKQRAVWRDVGVGEGRRRGEDSFVSTVTPTIYQHQCDTVNMFFTGNPATQKSYSRFSLNFFC